MSIAKVKGCKEYCLYSGRQIIVAWLSPYRFTVWENGKEITLESVIGCDVVLPEEAHAFCDRYSQHQGLSIHRAA